MNNKILIAILTIITAFLFSCAGTVKESETIEEPTLIPTIIPSPTPTPVSMRIIDIDPMYDPNRFISEIPVSEINCLSNALGSKQILVDLISAEPGTVYIDQEQAKVSDACLSNKTIERIIIGQLDLHSGGLSQNSVDCIKDRTGGSGSFVYLFAKDPPDETYLTILQALFCIDTEERMIFESSRLGKLTSALGGIEKIECIVNEIGPLGLNKLGSIFNSLPTILYENQDSLDSLLPLLSCGYLDKQLDVAGITSFEAICLLEHADKNSVSAVLVGNQNQISPKLVLDLVNAAVKCSISIENTNIAFPAPTPEPTSTAEPSTKESKEETENTTESIQSSIEKILKDSEITCLKKYISEEEIEMMVETLSPTMEMFLAITKCNINITEVLSRK